MRRMATTIGLGMLLLFAPVAGRAAPADPRADAIERVLPGQPIRLQTTDSTLEGRFVTNRSDSLLLARAAERVVLPYSDIQRIEVRTSARSRGMVVGMILGGLGLGAVAAAQGTTPFLAAASGVFFGGFLGGLLAGGSTRWTRVFDVHAPAHEASADTTTKRH